MRRCRVLKVEACVVAVLLISSASAFAQYAPPQQMRVPQLPPSLPSNAVIAPRPPVPPVVPSAPIAAPAPSPAAAVRAQAAGPEPVR